MVMLLDLKNGPFLNSPFLAGEDDSLRRTLADKLVAGRIEAGTPLLSQGEPNDRLWFVVDGSVAVEQRHPDGRVEVMASMVGPGIYGTTTFFRSTAPSTTIRATSALTLWTLDRAGHEALRKDDPRAAEALALAIVRVLSERFDLLDARLATLMAEHGDGHPRTTELAAFRARLFEDPTL
jgi:CRP/FNR family cyclic AMP-dependent transcriptional regulator